MPAKRAWSKLPPQDWIKIKAAYESDPTRPTYTALGKTYGIHPTTICARARDEKWHRHGDLALATIQAVESKSNAIVQETANNVANQIKAHFTDTLQPWLEKQKAFHLKSQVRRSKLALKQLDSHINLKTQLSPKDSSFVAKTAETWDVIMRRSLGMNDSQSLPGQLTLNVLTDHAAVQVKQGRANET